MKLEIQFTRPMKKVRFLDKVTVHEVGNSPGDRSARDGLQEYRDFQRFKLKLNEILINKLKKINL